MLGAVSSDDPLFLVSMCGTPEEFLAAFRRYVDRHGLFVPTATPAPALHHGRFAITLKDGSVMVEGEAEIASSSTRPSALYGRTGMTLHFTAVDEPSKQTLAALEKAKLSIKVTSQAATLQARPSRLTAPVVHPPVKVAGGSIDKTLGMAECVVVGELSKLIAGRANRATSRTGARASGLSNVPSSGAAAALAAGAVTPTSAVPPISASISAQAPALNPALAPASSTSIPASLTGRAHVIDDSPSEATEVGPIVEEAFIQPSGPTLTTPNLISPLPPEALAAAVMSGGKAFPIEDEIESTMGGPPPMPTSAPSPLGWQPSSPFGGGAAAGAGNGAPAAGGFAATSASANAEAPGASATLPSAFSVFPTPGASATVAPAPFAPAPFAPPAAQAAPAPPAPATPTSPSATGAVPVIPPIGAPRTPLGPAMSRPGASEPAQARAMTAPMPGLQMRPSVPAITPIPPPRPGMTGSFPAIAPLPSPGAPASADSLATKRPPSNLIPTIPAGGPATRPSIPGRPATQLIPTIPAIGPALGQPSAQAQPGNGASAASVAPASPAAPSLSGPATRPSSHVMRGATVSGHSGPMVRPASATGSSATGASTAEPAMGAPSPTATPASSMARLAQTVPAAPVVGSVDPASDRSERHDRRASSPIRKTSLGIAATYIEPAANPANPAAAANDGAPMAPLAGDESMGVPEAVHDSMFEIRDPEPWPEPARAAAPAAPADHRATRREGLPRSAKRPPTGRRPGLDGAFDDSDHVAATAHPSAAERLEGLIDRALEGGPSGRVEQRNGRASAPSISMSPSANSGAIGAFSADAGAATGKPARAVTAQMPPIPTRPSSAPGRLGRSSESVQAAPPELGPREGDESGQATPRTLPTPPSQPTVPIRPPSGSMASLAPAQAAPAGGAAASMAAVAGGAPNAVDETWATVPTTSPFQGLPSAPAGGLPDGMAESLRGRGELPVAAATNLSPAAAAIARREALAADVTESIDTEEPEDGVFITTATSAAGASGAVKSAAAGNSASARAASPFSDPSSVSEPLDAVSASRPGMAFEPAAQAAGADAGAGDQPLARAPSIDGEPFDIEADVEADVEPSEPQPAKRRDESSRHGRAHHLANAKVEIDPALYVESAIDQSFEANFVLPGSEAPPPDWQAQQQQQPWDPASAGLPTAPQQPYAYAPTPPESVYPPGYDMAFPQAYHSGDETALVMVPDVGRRRTVVIIGSAIFVLLACLAAYLLLNNRAKPSDDASLPSSGATTLSHPPESGAGSAASAAIEERSGDTAAAVTGDAKPTDCKLPLASTPTGATVYLAGDKLGVTPFTAALPCGKRATLTFHRDGSAEVAREVKPTAAATALTVELPAAAPAAEDAAEKTDAKPVKKLEMIDLEIVAPGNVQISVGGEELARGVKRRSVPVGIPVKVTISKGGRSASKTITPTAASHRVTLALKKARAPRKAPGPSGNSLDDL